jgi:hypothetical protein
MKGDSMRIFDFRLIIIVAFVIIAHSALGQVSKTFYADSTGRLYVNPGTPVYIYLSTSPDGKNPVRIKSMQPEGEPLIWNGHGVQFLTHLNLYLGRRIRFDLYADGIPPKTSTSFDPKVGVQKGNVFYLSGSSALELSANDPSSGVHGIYYSINNSEFQPYQTPFVFDKEGEYIIRFYAVDNVGNKEDEGERTVIVDTTPPETTINIEGTHHNQVITAQTRLSLKSSDKIGVKETFYSINDGKESRYQGLISIANLPEGDHTIYWYSKDLVGNIEEKKSFAFFVDRTPPMVFEEILGNTYLVSGKEYSSGRSQLRIVAVDNKAGVKEIYYSINNAPFTRYEKPIFLSEITGAISIRSYAIDNVNNKGTSDAEGQKFSMPQVDITGPNIAFSLTGGQLQIRDTLWIGPDTKINIQASDAGSGVNRIEYKVSNSEVQTYSEPFTLKQAGYFTVNATAWDNVDNQNVKSFSFGVDATPPKTEISIEGIQHNLVISTQTKLKLTATDELGVKSSFYKINSGNDTRYTGSISVANLAEGEHTIQYYSIDLAGNIEDIKSLVFFVDRTPPMVFEEIMGNTYMVAGKEYSSGRSQLRIVAVDNKAGVKDIYYSINNEPFARYEKPIFLSEITSAISIRSYAIDNVNNKGTSDAEGQNFSMPQVDITGPSIKHSFTGGQLSLRDTLWIGPNTKINLLAVDKGSGVSHIEFKQNNSSPQTYSEPFTLNQSGYFTINTTAWDNVNNLNIASFAFGVDAVAPEVFVNFSVKPHQILQEESESIPVFAPGVQIFAGATDNKTGVDRIMISINDAREKEYIQPISGFKSNQTHSVIIRGIDKLGNSNSIKVRFRVE